MQGKDKHIALWIFIAISLSLGIFNNHCFWVVIEGEVDLCFGKSVRRKNED